MRWIAILLLSATVSVGGINARASEYAVMGRSIDQVVFLDMTSIQTENGMISTRTLWVNYPTRELLGVGLVTYYIGDIEFDCKRNLAIQTRVAYYAPISRLLKVDNAHQNISVDSRSTAGSELIKAVCDRSTRTTNKTIDDPWLAASMGILMLSTQTQ